MNGGNVAAHRGPLMEDVFRAAQGAMLRRLGVTERDDVLAYHAGCTAKTIQNARMGHTSLSPVSLFNLARVYPSALDEILALIGLRTEPGEAADAGSHAQLMAGAAGFTSTVAGALADGRIDHQEERAIAEEARNLIQKLQPIVARHDVRKVTH